MLAMPTLALEPTPLRRDATVIGLVGVALDVVFGGLLSQNLSALVHVVESITGNELMPADVYYISGVPTVVNPMDVLTVTVVAIVMCLLATVYPAWRAAKTNPVEALRYE